MGVGTVPATDSNYRQQIGDSSTLFIGTQCARLGANRGKIGARASIISKA